MTREEFIQMMDEREKLIRTEYGLTQDKMALALGISKKTLVEIEKGRRTLGWTGAAALCVIFGSSCILQNALGGDATDLIRLLAFENLEPDYPKTMGGRVWWRDLETKKGWRVQQNVISGHFRLLDPKDRRVISSFEKKVIEERLSWEVKEDL